MYLGPPNGTKVIKTDYDDFWYARFGFLFCFYARFRGKKNYYVSKGTHYGAFTTSLVRIRGTKNFHGDK